LRYFNLFSGDKWIVIPFMKCVLEDAVRFQYGGFGLTHRSAPTVHILATL